ncbi:MAG: alpha/beta fold hydrolase [Deltaproteobacteria bacterium]|nr:alpha/beta fold hydrolase [Deltaproteobacteria bacterium]
MMATTAQTQNRQFVEYADLPGVRLWDTDSGGSGVPVVLLHANTGNADSWQYNIPGFVEAGYRVFTFDRRGWGRSIAKSGHRLSAGHRRGKIFTRWWNT